MTKTALVLITEGSEDLEAVTTIDVLRRGGIKTTITSLAEDKLVACANGVNVMADTLFSAITAQTGFDVLVLPGGSKAAETYSTDERVQDLLKVYEQEGKLVAVICASTLAIHAAKVFKGKKATSYPSLRSQVEDLYDYQEEDVVIDGNLITSRGPGTAMTFALAIVQALVGQERRDKVAAGLLCYD